MDIRQRGVSWEWRPYGFPGFAESSVGVPRRGRPVRPILDDRVLYLEQFRHNSANYHCSLLFWPQEAPPVPT